MNSNLFHNIANVLIAAIALVTAVLLALGCSSLPDGSLECSQSLISPTWSTAIISGLAVVKMIVNITRDGLSGLAKRQPPVQ